MPEPVPVLPDTLVLPEKTLFGRGTFRSLLTEGLRFGTRGVLVYGRSLEPDGAVAGVIESAPASLALIPYRHAGGEPTLAQVAELLGIARCHRADWIAGIGGGSILDLAKAAAALFRGSRSVQAYHDGAPIENAGITFLAVPTTAGTGSEATINAVLTNPDTGAKKSIRDIGMMARVVILDPELIAACPPAVIAASGMDALTQAVEAFISRKATWLSERLALQGLSLIAANLETVFNEPHASQADALLTGSYLTGIALSFARLGVVHGIAHPLGALYRVPHGLVCAACLPHAIELNRSAVAEKYRIMSDAVGGDLLQQVRDLSQRLRIVAPFAGRELREKDRIIRETLASGSTHANPRAITAADVEWLLDRLFTGHS